MGRSLERVQPAVSRSRSSGGGGADTGSDTVPRARCSVVRCKRNSMILSEPPLCSHHVKDLDGWYNELPSRIEAIGGDELQDAMVLGVAHDQYRILLVLQTPEASSMMKRFEKNLARGEDARFYLTDIVYFAVVAAATGILGNLAYDALKRLLKRITQDDEASRALEDVASEVFYEIRRKRRHKSRAGSTIVNRELEISLKIRYRLLVQRWDGKGD